MNEFIEKLIGRLEEQRGHICNCMPCNGCKYIGDCNEGEFAEDVALDKAIEIVNQLAEEYKGDKVNQLAMMYTKSIYLYGVDITEKWETAIQNHMALERAYMRGRQDERDRFAEWQDNGGWILCSDRLPTEVMLCWATIEEEQIRFVRKLRYYPMYGEWVHDNGQGISEHAKVIAWMEYNIPAPYEEVVR